MPTYRLGSSPLVHAPGLIKWAINAYAFPRDRAVILRVVTETWPGLPEEHAILLLSRALAYKLDDDAVVLEILENTATAAPAEPCVRATSRGTGEIGQ
ncbi:hypothetical protein [Mesorhizobium sp. M1E.F.Ca.ET.045.02.1.1]|uniref:hypothetical protein n=1 Tax=Mesorhizobium sp. M1E.F.Ca.ET.045.02.1.1 TaxID=2493672 RepID=UPI00167271C5|nr:hypothetical protein [Mesorhizobium sp. M1E.F.Ca.ET.045.02.1.1]